MSECDDIFPPPEPIEFPTDPQKLRERIRQYERRFRKEKQFGRISDGYGKRFLLGPMYMLLGDLPGTLKHFEWFEAEFGLNGECYQLLCWTLALYRSGDIEKAERLFRRTMLSNLYQIPALIGLEFPRQPIWHDSNLAEPSYIGCVPRELYALWSDDEKQWAREMWNSWEMTDIREAFIMLGALLEKLSPSRERNKVLHYTEILRNMPFEDISFREIRACARFANQAHAASLAAKTKPIKRKPRKGYERLSPRQRQRVAHEMKKRGVSTAEIAMNLGVSNQAVWRMLQILQQHQERLRSENPVIRGLAEMDSRNIVRIMRLLDDTIDIHGGDPRKLAAMGYNRLLAYKAIGHECLVHLGMVLEKLGYISSFAEWKEEYLRQKQVRRSSNGPAC